MKLLVAVLCGIGAVTVLVIAVLWLLVMLIKYEDKRRGWYGA